MKSENFIFNEAYLAFTLLSYDVLVLCNWK